MTIDSIVKNIFYVINQPFGWVALVVFMIVAILIVRGPSHFK